VKKRWRIPEVFEVWRKICIVMWQAINKMVILMEENVEIL